MHFYVDLDVGVQLGGEAVPFMQMKCQNIVSLVLGKIIRNEELSGLQGGEEGVGAAVVGLSERERGDQEVEARERNHADCPFPLAGVEISFEAIGRGVLKHEASDVLVCRVLFKRSLLSG